MADFLKRTKTDATDFVCGNSVPFPDIVRDDELKDALLSTNTNTDQTTAAVLERMFTAWETLLLMAAAEHLIGGEHSIIEGAKETLSVPRHNKFPERVFALLDALTRFRPVASTLRNEAYIMFSLNKTGEWLSSLTENERDIFLQQARSEGPKLRQLYKERTMEIETTRQDLLRKKIQENERKKDKDGKEKELIVNEVQYYGFWQYTETVGQMLKTYKTAVLKKGALKAQLRFRKAILEQMADKSLFMFSEKGKEHSVEKLKNNLLSLIDISLKSPDPLNKSVLLGKRIRHYFWKNGDCEPYDGRVVSVVPGYPEWLNVVYDNDPAVYVYKLTEDYKNEDLEILPEHTEVTAELFCYFCSFI